MGMTILARSVALLGALLLAAAALGACGDDDDVRTGTDDVSTDPDDRVSSPADGGSVDPPSQGDETFPSEAARERARDQLGRPESDLGPDVRVGRRGDEQMALTEDYVLGRITVELDDDGSGTVVVTQATVELPGGPETFTLDDD